MPRRSAAKTALPAPAIRAIAQLGSDVATARRRRKIPQRLMAERMLVSLQTLQRLEAGDPSVGLSVLATALFSLGMVGRLGELIAPESDTGGAIEDLARLPKRARQPRQAAGATNLDF